MLRAISRRGRLRGGAVPQLPNTDADSDTNAHADSDTNAHADSDTNANANTHTHTNANADTHTNARTMLNENRQREEVQARLHLQFLKTKELTP